MAKAPVPSPTPKEERLGLSFYPADTAAAGAVVAKLRRHGVRTSRRIALKVLVHASSEEELFAYALARARAEEMGTVKVEPAIDEIFGYTFFADDVEKLDRVNDRLDDENLRGGRSFIVRSRLHAPINYAQFAKAVLKFQQQYPDGRSKAGRKLAGRD